MIRLNKKKYLIFPSLGAVFAVAWLVYAEKIRDIRNLEKTGGESSDVLEVKGEEKEYVVNNNVSAGEGQDEIQPVDATQEDPDPASDDKPDPSEAINRYPIHRNITSSLFWAGEKAGKDNKEISNLRSAWDDRWVKHFGGVDDPKRRNGFFPVAFVPKENPFYVALPYNDFDKDGERKAEIFSLASWAKEGKLGAKQSYCKNRWVRITRGGKSAYAQWEDVGPFGESDKDYVFGSAAPKIKTNHNVGIDVSPSVRDYLGLGDIDKVDWQFADADQVSDGPWKKIITTSQLYWN